MYVVKNLDFSMHIDIEMLISPQNRYTKPAAGLGECSRKHS